MSRGREVRRSKSWEDVDPDVCSQRLDLSLLLVPRDNDTHYIVSCTYPFVAVDNDARNYTIQPTQLKRVDVTYS
jgi:hypothetical protein